MKTMDKDFGELIEYLDQRFEKIDQRFEKIDQRFEKVDQRFEQIDQRFIKLEVDVGEIKSVMVVREDFDNLLTAIDSYAKKSDAYFQEMVMLSHKVDRHEKWFHQIAEKLGIKLDY